MSRSQNRRLKKHASDNQPAPAGSKLRNNDKLSDLTPAWKQGWPFILLTALVVCGVHLWQVSRSPFLGTLVGDAEGYSAWAHRIAHGEWVGAEVFYQAPLYPYFLALVYAVTGSDFHLIFILQMLLHAGSCLLLAFATARFVSRRAGTVAGLLLALYPAALFHVSLLEKSTIDIFFVCLALWFLSLAIQRRSLGWWFGLGAVLGGLTLTRENSVVFLVAVLVWLVTCHPESWRRCSLFGSLLLVGFCLVLLPVVLRNYAVGGHLYLTTSQFGPNFYMGNNEWATGKYYALIPGRGSFRFERRDATELAEKAEGRKLSPAEVSGYWSARAFAYIRSHPGHWLKLLVRKAALAGNAVEAMDTVDQYTYARWSWPLKLLDHCWHFGLLAILTALGIWCTWKERRQLAPLYFMLVAYELSLLVFYIMARYRLPMIPLMIVFAAAGVTRVIGCWRDSSQAGKVFLPAFLLVVAVVAHWPLLNGAKMGAVTYSSWGVALEEKGRPLEAVGCYREALQINPDFPDAHLGLANALAALGNSNEAISHYGRALQLKPDFVEAHHNLGVALLKQGQNIEAIGQFQEAIRLRPDYAEAHNNLGVAFLNMGQFDEAIGQFQEVVRLNPDSAAPHHNLGIVLDKQGRIDEAIRQFQAALRLKSDYVDAHYNLGIAFLKQGRIDEAIAHFHETIRYKPDAPGAHYNLGRALAQLGRREEAIMQFTEALRLKPDYLEAKTELQTLGGTPSE